VALRTGALTAPQRELIERWLPGGSVVRDHSWGLVGTTVLEVLHDGARYIVKAGDVRDVQMARELRAHREWLRPWAAAERAPELVHGDPEAKLLITRYLPGHLVQGHAEEWRPDTYRQAGVLLAQLHGQLAIEDTEFEAASQQKALQWLDASNRIAPAIVAQLRAEVRSWDTPSVISVPTHGDWQPRNWLMCEGVVSVIDFGRAALRPAFTDIERLEAQQFRKRPELEAAFLEGYGCDPRDPELSRRNQLCASIGTAVWAYQVGDEAFEQQGHRMIAEALAAS